MQIGHIGDDGKIEMRMQVSSVSTQQCLSVVVVDVIVGLR